MYHAVGPKWIGIRLSRAGTGVTEERGPRFGIIEGKGDVRYSITVDERDRQERRDRHFCFLEEHLVGMFPRLTLTSPPDKVAWIWKRYNFESYLLEIRAAKFLRIMELCFLNMGVDAWFQASTPLWNLGSLGIFRRVEWQLITYFSGQTIGPVFKGQGTAWPFKMGPIIFSRNVG